MNIQRKNSAHHFRMQSEREQTLISLFVIVLVNECNTNVMGLGCVGNN